MKLLIIILTTLFFSLSSFGQVYKTVVIDGVMEKDTAFVYPKQYNSDNYQGFINDSLPNGRWVAYFDDSVTIAFIGYYKSGKPNGLFHYYFKNGKIRRTTVYKDGIEDGPFTFWHKSGTISIIGQMVNDKREGVWYDWYSNGKLRIYRVWENDKQNGIDKYYNSNGSLKRVGYFSKEYHVGEWKYYHKNGKLKEQQFFVDSLSSKEMKVITKYENIFASLYFPVGTWKKWDEKGNLITEITFDDNYGIEKRIEYYPSGTKKAEINFEGYNQGFCSQHPSTYIKNGLLQEWYEDGQLKTKGIWKNNKKEGKWTYWTSSGNIQKIEVFKGGEIIE